MTCIASTITKYSIYKNKNLEEFILSLEEKYNIKDKIKKYHNLVNFGENLEITYHRWFKYREGYSAELVRRIINNADISPKEYYILDPFCGSGTTMVVASSLGFSSIGIDVNPLSAFITKLKNTHFKREDVAKIEKEINSLKISDIYFKTDKYNDIAKYFNEDNFYSLLKIKNFIDSINDSKIKTFFLGAFLCIIEACSNRKRDGNGLKTQHTKIKDPIQYFKEKAEDMLSDIKGYSIPDEVCTDSIADNSAYLYKHILNKNKRENKQLGLIIFSPPYANSFDYFESYKLELVFCDFAENIAKINNYRHDAVRSFVKNSNFSIKNNDIYINMLAEEIKNAIPEKEILTGKRDSRTRKVPAMIKGYFSDMQDIMQECSLSLPKGKRCYIVVDQSSYLGKIVPTDLLFGYIAEKCGFKVIEIDVCRSAKTSGQQIQRFPYLKTAQFVNINFSLYFQYQFL